MESSLRSKKGFFLLEGYVVIGDKREVFLDVSWMKSESNRWLM